MRRLLVASIVYLYVMGAQAETPWERYVALPTASNAQTVQAIQYSPGTLPADQTYEWRHLQLLETQVVAGDSEAFRLAFRLRATADGALLEELTYILGRLIRPHPEQFLEQLQILRPGDNALKRILLMTGEEYVDLADAQTYELTMRHKAIASVTNAKLMDIRDACLKVLEQ